MSLSHGSSTGRRSVRQARLTDVRAPGEREAVPVTASCCAPVCCAHGRASQSRLAPHLLLHFGQQDREQRVASGPACQGPCPCSGRRQGSMGKSRPSRGMRSQGVPGTPGTHGRRLHHPVRPCPVPCAWRLSCPAHWCGLRPCLLLVRQGLAPWQTVSGRGLPVLTPQDRSVLSGLWCRPLFPGQLFVCPALESAWKLSGPHGTNFRNTVSDFWRVCLLHAGPGRTPCCLCRRMLERHSFLRMHGAFRQGLCLGEDAAVLRMVGFLFVVQSPVSGQAVSRHRALLQRPAQNALAV